ncbi:MAG: putative lipid II flippase FtsW [bacterium]
MATATAVEQPRSLIGTTYNLLALVVALLALGVVMAASTAPVRNPALTRYLVIKHTLWLGLSTVALYLAYSVDIRFLRRWSTVLLALSLASLVGVLFLGVRINGARRWYRFGLLSFQPSELFKVALCLYMADFFEREQARIKTFFKGFLQPVAIMGLAFGLILAQPDFGTALLIAAMTFAMLYIAGIRMIHVLPGALASTPLLVYLVMKVPERIERILAFLNPWQDPQGAGYQVIQSLLALGSGGLFGIGLGNSRQKLLFLPEANNDFVFAIIGEELGLVGCTVVVALFALLFWYGVRVARRAPDLFSSLLVFGLTLMIGIQAAVNIAVVTCSAPTKGLALPFVSSGGSSLVATMVAMGLILNVASRVEIHTAPPAVGAVKLAGRP